MALAKGLLARRMARTPDWVARLVRLDELLKRHPIPAPAEAGGQAIDPVGFYFTNLSMGLDSVEALGACFAQLDALPVAARDVVLARLRKHKEEIAHTINHPWVAERAEGEIEGRSRAETYARLAGQAARWGYPEVAVRCHVARSIMLDEYADDEAGALAALQEAEAELGAHSVISRARAKIAFRRSRHGDALTLLREVMRGGHSQDAVERMFLCREAAISATEVGERAEALDWFRQALGAARNVKSDNLQVAVVGLQADVALAEFRCGDSQAALRNLWASLEAARPIDPAASLKATYLQKVLGHACLWLNAQITGEAYPVDVAPPGMCSNPEPSEDIRTLPPASLEGSHYLLASADTHGGGALGFDSALDGLLEGRHIFALECQRRLGRLERAVGTLNLVALRPILEEALEAMCLGVQRMQAQGSSKGSLPLVADPFPRLPEAERLGDSATRFVNDAFFALELLADLRGDTAAIAELPAIAAAVAKDGYAAPTYVDDTATRQGECLAIWQRARAASPILAEDLFMTGLRMMEWASISVFARAVLPDLGRWALAAWPRILEAQRFRLKNPAITVPAIEAAMAMDMPEVDRLAAILAAARSAFNFNLPAEIVSILKPRQMPDRGAPA
jgi:tetratricopeptide (TPR) repeat protein